MSPNWNDAPEGFHPASAPDYLPREQLRQTQLQRLQAVVRRAWDHQKLFRRRMEERGLSPADVVTALQSSNVIIPAGTARIGDQYLHAFSDALTHGEHDPHSFTHALHDAHADGHAAVLCPELGRCAGHHRAVHPVADQE